MKKKNSLSSYLFILPAFVIYVSIVVGPAFYSLFLSFFKWNGVKPKVFVGFKNFINLFANDKIFLISLKNNFLWVVMTLFITMLVALGFAVLFNRTFKGRAFFRSYFYFPYTLSLILVAIVWRQMYDPSMGFLNEFLRLIGLEKLTSTWISDPKISLICIFVAASWRAVGQPMILFLAGLQTVPIEVLEAAKIDGASSFRKFFYITVPMLKETFVIVFATLFISSMKVYDIISGMTRGGPANSTQTMATYMHAQTFLWGNFGRGTAISVIMLLIMLVIIIPYVSFTARQD